MDFPFRLLQPFLGPRIIKTGLAVFLSLALFTGFGSDYAIFAAVAAILAIQPTVAKAREVFRQQFLGNVVAGAIAAAIGLWLPINPVTMALGAILVLGLLVRFKLVEAASLAVVVVLFIMDRPQHDFLFYTGARLGAIAGGMAVGYLVNRFIRPPDVQARARLEIRQGMEQVERFINRLETSLSEPERYAKEQIKQEVASIQRHLGAARTFLELAEGEADTPPVHVLKKANNSMFVFSEAGMDIHKLALELGGLGDGPEHDSVAEALQAVREYMQAVMLAALEGIAADPSAAQRFEEALGALRSRVEEWIDRRENRTRGLLLHGIYAEIRHMGWRMSSLSRLLA